jgi:hypothetical protein
MIFSNRNFRAIYVIAAMAAALGASFHAAPARADAFTIIAAPDNPNGFPVGYFMLKVRHAVWEAYVTQGTPESQKKGYCGVLHITYTNPSGEKEYTYPLTGKSGCNAKSITASNLDGNVYFQVTTDDGGENGTGAVTTIVQQGGVIDVTPNPSNTEPVGGSNGPPQAGVLALTPSSAAATIYITSLNGGASGNGAIYAATMSSTGVLGAETLIFSFPGGKGGAEPGARAVVGADGYLYGTTASGGLKVKTKTTDCGSGCGLVYRLKPPATKSGKWTEEVLHTFTASPDFEGGGGRVTFDADGNVYSTSPLGGSNGAIGGVWMLTKQSTVPWPITPLYEFDGGDDGELPSTGVTLDEDGNVYGTAGGGAGGQGVVFELTKPATPTSGLWTEVLLHSFAGGTHDGADPSSELTLFDDDIYGTTSAGGHPGNPPCKGLGPNFNEAGCGVVFELTPK